MLLGNWSVEPLGRSIVRLGPSPVATLRRVWGVILQRWSVGTQKHRLARVAVAVSAVVAGACVLSWSFVRDQSQFVCGRCGSAKEETRFVLLGLTVATVGGSIRPGPRTQEYDAFVGVPHEHLWLVWNRTTDSWRMPLGHERRRCFAGIEEDPRRLSAMDRALRVLRHVSHWPRQERIALFEDMIQCTDDVSLAELERLASHGSEQGVNDWLGRRRHAGATSVQPPVTRQPAGSE